MDLEIEEVNQDPDHVGINIDQKYIVDGIYERGLEAVKTEWAVRYGAPSVATIEAAEKTGIAQEELTKKVLEQKAKVEKLKDYLSQFPRLAHVRVHPYAVESPAITGDLNKDFLKQMGMILEKCGDTTLVVPFYNSKKGTEHCADVPVNDEEITGYIAICDALLAQFGDKLQLEIGNETNVTRQTGEMFTSLQFATHTVPQEYAKFYSKVSGEVKTRYPNVKLALAGVACFDPQYLTTVLSLVSLVDTVSIHPYRQDPEQGTAEINNGRFTNRKMAYGQQLEEFLEIVKEYSPKARVIVGEIGFSLQDPNNQQKLARSIELTKQKGIISFIYPRSE